MLLLAALLYPAFAIADYIYYPQWFREFLVLRLTISVICISLMLLLKKRGPKPDNIYLILLGLYPVCFGILWMIWRVGDPSSPYYAGLILIFIGFAAIVPASFRFHLTQFIIVLFIYLLIPYLHPLGTQEFNLLVLNNIFIASYALLVLVAARTNFFLLKKNFIAKKKLEEANRKLDEYAGRLEARVSESESNYELLVNSTPDAIFVLQNGLVKFANQQAAEMLGTDIDRLLEAPLHKYIPEPVQKALEQKYAGIRSIKKPVTLEPQRLSKKEGEDRWLDIILVPIDWKERPAILHIARDITEKRVLEEELLQSQKLEAVGRLAGGVAHEINNMLQIIAGYVQLLALKDQVSSQGKEYLDKIFEATANASAITKQLLLYCRKAASEKKTADLNEIVEKSVTLLRKTLPRVITVQQKSSGTIPKIEADPVQIEQVIMNLAINARDAMPSGGSLTITLKQVSISNRPGNFPIKPGEYVLMEIADTGTGMEKQVADRIFDPFYTTKEVGKGTGLGLTIVYGIIKGHDGYIFCDTEPGKGTTFRIYLPVKKGLPGETDKLDNACSDANREKDHQEMDGHGRTLLIVDDESHIREIFTETLSASGFNILTADSGTSGLEIIRKRGNEIDLIILDLNMPEMGGLEMLELIREMGIESRVIVATGFAKDIDRNTIKTLGISVILKKPFYISDLKEAIEKALFRENQT